MEIRYELEYPLKCSNKVLFPRLSTPEGLAEWFADDVNADGDIYTFSWGSTTSKARLTILRENKLVRFNWIETDSNIDDNYFEFRVNIEELGGDLALIVSDKAAPDEKEDAVSLWDTEIQRLRSILGL
jgi:hypothetical protein